MGQQGQAAKQRREGKALALCAFPASWFTGLLAVALPGVADIRLFYAAAAVFFGWNAATVGSAESMPFCLLTAGDLSRLLWVHPKWPGLALGEMLLLCLPTGFFFASVAALVGSLSSQEHLATLVCCLLWLAALLTRSLLRLPGVEYVYPFLRFAGDQHGVWLWNKAALTGTGAKIATPAPSARSFSTTLPEF